MENKKKKHCCNLYIQFVLYLGDEKIIYCFYSLSKFITYKKLLKEKLKTTSYYYSISILQGKTNE